MPLFGGICLPGKPDPANTQKLDVLPIGQIARMMKVGIAIDKPYLASLSDRLESKKSELKRDIISYVPVDDLEQFVSDNDEVEFNVESSVQVANLLFQDLRIASGERLKTTKSGKRISAGKKQLEALKRRHPIVPLILAYREASKLKSMIKTVVDLSIPEGDLWTLRTEIVSTRTATGRLACVAAWTPIKVKDQGELPIEQVRVGDLVWTHKSRWRPVTAIWRKGIALMYSVRFSTGHVLTCTGDHLLLVSPNEYIQTLDSPAKQYRTSLEALQITGGSDPNADSSRATHDLPQHSSRVQNESTSSRIHSFTGNTVLSLQEGREESYVWEAWGRTPQLDRSGGRWVRVSDIVEGRQAAICAPDSYGRSVGTEGTTRGIRCASYRYGHQEQRVGQSSTSYYGWPQEDSYQADQRQPICYVEEIQVAGSLEVYDISVDEDESYEACGVFSHNSRKPNLQNIGARSDLGREFRAGFIARPGKVLISVDFSQIELRLLAHAANEPNMLQVFYDKGDIHVATAMRAFNIDDPAKVDKLLHRAPSKNLNFAVGYSISAPGLYDLMALTYATAGMDMPDWLTLDWCDKFILAWFDLYPKCKDYFELQHYRAHRYGIVWTQFGRVRRIPEMMSCHARIRQAGLRQAGNMPIQGMAADVMKLAMARVEYLLQSWRDAGIYVEALLPVHDELLVECDPKWADDIKDLIIREFELAMVDEATGELQCRCPILADGKIMSAWQK